MKKEQLKEIQGKLLILFLAITPYLHDGIIAVPCKHITGFNDHVNCQRTAIKFTKNRRRKAENFTEMLHDNSCMYHIQALF